MAVTLDEAQSNGPLAGVRILDLTRVIVGNVMTQTLGDMGADVIKVEPPEGDSLRHWIVKGVPIQWKVYGRNKRSVVLDLKAAEDRAMFGELVSTAQILVENYRPGVLDRLGFPTKRLHELQPGLVIVRISGWGQTGPYRNRPGFGTLIEAASGFAHKNGFPDSPPLLPNLGLADAVAGLHAAAAALAALRVSEASGSGQEIDISIFEPLLAILGADQAVHRVTGEAPGRHGNRSSLAAPRNLYKTRDDKFIALSSSTQTMTERLFRCIGREDLIKDRRFATNQDRVENVEELDLIIAAFIGKFDMNDALQFFETAEVTVGPVYDGASLMENEHIRERGSVVEFPDEQVGTLPMHNVVPRFSLTPGQIWRRAPTLNEHVHELRDELAARASLAAPTE
jgi:crotonobetainyl-CoA:carnitine CoA-transferase CaiB-like acyl-CoA transferase